MTDEIYKYNIDIEKPRYDQSTYIGRAKHFFITTNPLNILKTSEELDNAASIVRQYRNRESMQNLTPDELWKAKQTYDSAYHPDTGEKMLVFGRMAFQVPGNMFITGCLLQFYKSTPAVIFWQWFNQTFNAAVNYTNRSGDSPISITRLSASYVLATSGAVATALGINKQIQRFPPIVARFVPFVAVAAANCINIPCMRSTELSEGTKVTDDKGETLGHSTAVGRRAVAQVVISRVLMAVPGMMIPPIIMDRLEKRGFLGRYPWVGAPLQLEPTLQKKIKENRGGNAPDVVFYNKGL